MFLGISLWIFGLRRTEAAGRAFSMMAASLAIVIGALFDLYTSHRFTLYLDHGRCLIWRCFDRPGTLVSPGSALCARSSIPAGGLDMPSESLLALNAYLKLYDFRIRPLTLMHGGLFISL